MKELKIPVSSRILPDLKEELEMEAQEAGLTTSLYLEQILQNRHAHANLGEAIEADAEGFQAEIKRLKGELTATDSQLKEVRKKRDDCVQALIQAKQELSKATSSLQQLEDEIQPLKSLGLVDLSPSEIIELEDSLSQLAQKYPSHSRQYLFLAALNRTVKNEKGMFIIHTIDNY